LRSAIFWPKPLSALVIYWAKPSEWKSGSFYIEIRALASVCPNNAFSFVSRAHQVDTWRFSLCHFSISRALFLSFCLFVFFHTPLHWRGRWSLEIYHLFHNAIGDFTFLSGRSHYRRALLLNCIFGCVLDRRMKNLPYFTLCAACGWSVENRVHLTPPDSDSITQKAGGNQAAGKWLLNKFPPPTAGRGHHCATKGRRWIIYCISHRVHFFVPQERQNSICNFNKCEIRHSFPIFCAAWMKNEQNARQTHSLKKLFTSHEKTLLFFRELHWQLMLLPHCVWFK
jgi:hypothetical protein